jgi:glutaredoxin
MAGKLLRWGLGLAALSIAGLMVTPGVRSSLSAELRRHLPGILGGESGVWQWVDEHGSVQFARSLDDIPPAYRSTAGRIPMSAKALANKRSTATPVTAEAAPTDERVTPSRAVTHAARSAPAARGTTEPAILYISSAMPNYDGVVSALDEGGFAYRIVDIDKDEDAKERLIEITAEVFPSQPGGTWAVPMIEAEGAYFWGDGPIGVREMSTHLAWVRRGRPVENPNVYVTSWCPFSKQLMGALDEIGQPYEMRDIERDPEAHAELMEATGSAGIPVTIVMGKVIHGADLAAAQQIAEAAHPPDAHGLSAFFHSIFGH